MITAYLQYDYLGYTMEMSTFRGNNANSETSIFPYPSAKWKLACTIGSPSAEYIPVMNYVSSTWSKLVENKAGSAYLGHYINYIDYNVENFYD